MLAGIGIARIDEAAGQAHDADMRFDTPLTDQQADAARVVGDRLQQHGHGNGLA